MYNWISLPYSRVAKSRTRLSDFTFTFHFYVLEKEMATHSSVLAWRIPGTGEPGGLPSMGLPRVRRDWSDLAAAAAAEINTALQINCKCVKLLSHVWLSVAPWTASHPLSIGFSRQEHWSGLPFPSPMHEGEKWKWSHSVMSDPQRCYGLQPTRLLRPWDFPGKSTGVGCHCLLRPAVQTWLFTGCMLRRMRCQCGPWTES